jgi:two-component system, OmpR family, Ni(II)-sensor and/or redox sensor kinase NrsS
MNSQQLFRRSRLCLATGYAVVMGTILGLSSFAMYEAIVQASWNAIEREVESIAGTLHDSVEPMLPQSTAPTSLLQQIFPELCIVAQPCSNNPTLIQRHTTGISDRKTYYIRLYNAQGQILAYSPNHPVPLPPSLNPTPWQIQSATNGSRYRQFTIILHSSHAQHKAGTPSHQHPSWGYFQVGRTLVNFDAETLRLRWLLAIGLPITLILVVASSWWLAGLAMQPIYQSYQQQQQFIADAAHELRSPLASLLATVEALMRLPQTEQKSAQTMLQTIDRQGRRLAALITDLLLLSRLEQNHDQPQFATCCLNTIISDLVEEFSEIAVQAEITLVSHSLPDDLSVVGDEQQLYRATANLIMNAIHYTPSQGKIQVNLERHDRTASITVQDTGIGISPQEQQRIFDRFYRVNQDRARSTGGTGLGLAIAQAIVKTHGGSIKVQSKLNLGSQFIIHLPCTPRYTAQTISEA